MGRSLFSAFWSVASARVIVMVLGAISTPLLTRILGASLYGQYATILAVFGLLKTLMSSGVVNGAQKYFSEDRDINNWKDYVWAYYSRLGGLLALIVAAILVFGSASGVVASVFGTEYTIYFYLVALWAIVTQYREFTRRVLMGLHLENHSEKLRIGQQTTFILLAVGLAYFNFGVAGVITGHIISNILMFTIGIFLVWQKIDIKAVLRPIPSTFPKKELAFFNHTSIVYIFLLTSLYHVDILMLQRTVDDATVGYYKAALVLVELLWVAPQSLQQVLIQSVSDLWRTNAIDKINNMAVRATRYVLLFTLLCATGLAALADVFVPFFFGAEYSPAVKPLLFLLPGTLGFAVARPILAITHAKGSMKPLIAATGFTAVLNLVLNALLIPSYGTVGAAVATTIGYGSLLITQTLCAKYIGYNPVSLRMFLRAALTVVVAGPIIFWLSNLFDGIISLIIVPPLGALIFITTAILAGGIPRNDLQKIANQLPDNRFSSL
ncbi:polysaccharide biosynthesis C-terminal domain-containing protein [Haloarcula sp. H-GB4]|uniref:lipopolysaccharide biosynthesis protein n=1 Tax=Haloarcula sp. H-GB4 TaxID=3069755 RepID=UPI0027B86A1F|nr:polysaccharide biosynthesis C-terminal domain-containing protein [Haloarcula sp. H-GB4]MDQ2072357.1 polysaccharide biosynthesis C-terminal domain-containing protein [Haloarcula sp. H-GB4]